MISNYKLKLRTSLFSWTVGDSGGVSETKDFDFATPVHSGLVLKELCLCKIVGIPDSLFSAGRRF